MRMPTELERRLMGRIHREGRITFRDFMEVALYDPEAGYYSTNRIKIGAAGDYYTSSNVHRAFGAVLAKALVELWSDSRLTLAEIGGGTGRLAFDVLSTIRDDYPAVFDTVTYIIVESSLQMIRWQREKLETFGDRVQWRELDELERAPIAGIAFSNELVDALPVHRIRIKGGAIEEQYVSKMSEGLEETLALDWRPPSTERLKEYVSRMGVPLLEGQIVEVSLDAIDWLARMSRVVSSGCLITIDYGDVAQHLWSADRQEGTLRSFYKHRLVDTLLRRIGEQDITASVNFTALIEYGRDYGFQVHTFERQTAFLIRMGLIERIAAQYSSINSVDDLNERLSVKNLFVPGGISDHFRVLVQRR